VKRFDYIVLTVGAVLALLVGSLATWAAWEHNPQGLYQGDIVALMSVFCVWALCVFVPFFVFAMCFKVYQKLKHKA